jgi:shikimate kinase
MGCGKSSVGRRLAHLTGHRFVDTDDLIIEKSGMPIPALFAEQREDGFRQIESQVLADLIGVCGIVLATGGGIVTRPQNLPVLHDVGIVGWLDSDPDLLFERVFRNQRRPLLQTGDPRATFDQLLASRLELYESASDFRVDSSGRTHDEAARDILDESMRAQARRQQV